MYGFRHLKANWSSHPQNKYRKPPPFPFLGRTTARHHHLGPRHHATSTSSWPPNSSNTEDKHNSGCVFFLPKTRHPCPVCHTPEHGAHYLLLPPSSGSQVQTDTVHCLQSAFLKLHSLSLREYLNASILFLAYCLYCTNKGQTLANSKLQVGAGRVWL